MTILAKHRKIARTKTLPKLRFPSFNGEWVENTFENIFNFKPTNSLSREFLNYNDGDVKNIHYGDIHIKFQTNFNICNEDVPFINNGLDISKYKDENFCKEGDIVIADASEDYLDIGKSIELKNLNNEKVVAGLHTYIARPEEDVFALGFPGYLMQTRTIRLQIMMLAQGTKVLGISTRHLAEIIFKTPSILEQQKIASFLTVVDDKIQQLIRKKELLEQYKKGVMQKIFSQKIRFKDKNGEEFPEWGPHRIGELITERVIYPEDKLPLYSLTIEKGIVPKSERYERSFLVNNIGNAYKMMKTNDFAFNPMNLRFGAIAKHKKPIEVSVSKYYNIFYCNKKVNHNYLELFLTTNKMIQYYNKMATGSLLEKKRVHYSDFIKFKFDFPSMAEQNKISNFIIDINKKIDHVNIQFSNTKKFKKGLLQQMFV